MNTMSLCNVCYMEIPAVTDPFVDDMSPMLYKICPVHGMQRGKLESDREFYSKYNTYERNNHYPVLIINVTDHCNIKCKHCYYPVKNKWDMKLETFKQLIETWKHQFSVFIISGGDPTCWEHYEEAGRWARENGIILSQLTNGVKLDDPDFWELVKANHRYDDKILAEISIHPSDITDPKVREKQLRVLAKVRQEGLKLSCIMMNVSPPVRSMSWTNQIMSEVIDFMMEWSDVTVSFRIRPACFEAWAEVKPGPGLTLSEICRSLSVTGAEKGVFFEHSHNKDVDNIYNQNFKIKGSDVDVVTVCAANVRDLDIGYLNRGPFMLANDGLPYSVPHALIVNEGIDKGWYRGSRI